MKKIHFWVILLLITAGSFLAGYWVNHEGGSKPAAERVVLYYVDPMNPAYRSDKPGISPSCGMPLEPVYADKSGGVGIDSLVPMPPGTIRILPEKQQLIGVRVLKVEKAAWSHSVRVLGRVTPDETLIYRVNAAVNGWIEEISPVTTGSLVKENELLATFYSVEYRNLVQNYFNLINISKEGSPGAKAVTQSSKYSVGQLKQLREAASAVGQAGESSQIDYYRKSLYNFGMSPYQVNEMERTRTIPNTVEIRAPSAGFILYRNVSPGLRFDRGTEFFRIADLSRVWIVADLFETEASYFKPGMRVRMELPYQKKTLHAEVSSVLPQFDPASRTLKMRLVAENPGYIMRPDMFVNLELPIAGPPAIIVPVDAVLDSGLKKTVFVDRGNGYFEPRSVETGRSLGERVEIVRGLMQGEKIVVSGNFLIDSEARMQQAAAGTTGKVGRDPVCGMNIDEDRSRAEGNERQYKGTAYFFCSPECREDFVKEPERYLKAPAAAGKMPTAGPQDAAAKHDHQSPAAVPKPPGAKSAHEGHEGMSMPGMPDAATMPGSMPMPRGTAPMFPMPMPGSKEDPMLPPAGGVPAADMGSPSFPGPGGMPMPGTKAGGTPPPATGAPEMKE